MNEQSAEIRNKLGPIKNLLALLTVYNQTIDMEQRVALWMFIEREIKNAKFSLKRILELI